MTASSSPRDRTKNALHLTLFVAGTTGKSMTAMANLKRLRAEWLPAHCTVEVIDLLQNPALAKAHEIFALPTLLRLGAGPTRRILGDLSDTKRVLAALGLPSA